MIVGSVNSELRTEPGPGAPHEVGEVVHELVEPLVGDVVDGRRDQPALAQRDRHADVRGRSTAVEHAVAEVSVELGEVPQRQRRPP